MWTPPDEATEPLLALGRYLMWFAFAIFTMRLIWYAGLIAWNRERAPQETEPAARAVTTLVAATACSGASGIAASLLTFL